jgi:hypothetical protein
LIKYENFNSIYVYFITVFFSFKDPYNTLVFNAVNNFGNSLAAEYIGVSVDNGAIYVRKSLTQIAVDTLVVSFLLQVLVMNQ